MIQKIEWSVQRLRLFLLSREELTILSLGIVGLISQFVSFAIPAIGYLGLPLVSLVPGYSLMLHVAPRDRIARISIAFPTSLVVSSLYGLLLAVLGILNQITISAGLFLLSLFLMLSSRRRSEYNLDPYPSLSRLPSTSNSRFCDHSVLGGSSLLWRILCLVSIWLCQASIR